MTRHVRVLKASVDLYNTGILNQACLNSFLHITEDFLKPLQEKSVKHILLQTPSEDEPVWRWLLNNPANNLSQEFRITYRNMMLQISLFPLLTSFEISGTCFAFITEDDLGEYVGQLPNLIRFRAHSTATPTFPTPAHLGELAIRIPLNFFERVETFFQSLESFEFLGIDLDSDFFKILSIASKLKKLHIYLQDSLGLVQKMKSSISDEINPWPSLRSVILSKVDRTNPLRIWLEEWGDGRDQPVRVMFHQSQRLPTVPGQENPEDQNGPEGEDGDDLSDVETDLGSDQSELSEDDWTSSAWIREHE
ncbi:hypothetical protein DFH28DRAFT_1049599 [Melampsora americana]|nr:hypothetical protein DFH28DRAFT_1049599 [Melampsora americana]